MRCDPVPAVPTAVEEMLRRPRHSGLDLSPADLHLLVLGLGPATAAALAVLAGCGVRGFVVLDDSPVRWEDARAGAYRVAEIGRPRSGAVRARIRAALPEAAPVSSLPEGWLERPGALVLRSHDGQPPEEPALGRVPEPVPVLDVSAVRGHAPGTVLLGPLRPWHARACPECLRAAAGVAAPERADLPEEAVPAHTGWAAALIAQTVLGALCGSAPAGRGPTESGPAPGPDRAVLLRPGRLSTRHAARLPGGCPVCSPAAG